MLLKQASNRRITARGSGFSTLYRVDAIEAFVCRRRRRRDAQVSVPSIGSMLLKPEGGLRL